MKRVIVVLLMLGSIPTDQGVAGLIHIDALNSRHGLLTGDLMTQLSAVVPRMSYTRRDRDRRTRTACAESLVYGERCK